MIQTEYSFATKQKKTLTLYVQTFETSKVPTVLKGM